MPGRAPEVPSRSTWDAWMCDGLVKSARKYQKLLENGGVLYACRISGTLESIEIRPSEHTWLHLVGASRAGSATATQLFRQALKGTIARESVHVESVGLMRLKLEAMNGIPNMIKKADRVGIVDVLGGANRNLYADVMVHLDSEAVTLALGRDGRSDVYYPKSLLYEDSTSFEQRCIFGTEQNKVLGVLSQPARGSFHRIERIEEGLSYDERVFLDGVISTMVEERACATREVQDRVRELKAPPSPTELRRITTKVLEGQKDQRHGGRKLDSARRTH